MSAEIRYTSYPENVYSKLTNNVDLRFLIMTNLGEATVGSLPVNRACRSHRSPIDWCSLLELESLSVCTNEGALRLPRA